MRSLTGITKQIRINWIVSLAVLLSAIVVLFSSFYFLYLPLGYQGGRNPNYGINILFSRATWDMVHLWSGIVFSIAILVHLPIHWKWIKGTANRVWSGIRNGKAVMNKKVRLNIVVDVIIALSFAVTAVSGMYFAFFPKHSGSGFLFSGFTWDMIHTWSGIGLVLAGLAHFAIHWSWITKITPRVLSNPFRKETLSEEPLNGNPVLTSM